MSKQSTQDVHVQIQPISPHENVRESIVGGTVDVTGGSGEQAQGLQGQWEEEEEKRWYEACQECPEETAGHRQNMR